MEADGERQEKRKRENESGKKLLLGEEVVVDEEQLGISELTSIESHGGSFFQIYSTISCCRNGQIKNHEQSRDEFYIYPSYGMYGAPSHAPFGGQGFDGQGSFCRHVPLGGHSPLGGQGPLGGSSSGASGEPEMGLLNKLVMQWR